MNDVSDRSKLRRAERLLRWYPRSWRARYGEEFTELLIAELSEQPRSWRRAADVARGGLSARLSTPGYELDASQAVRASLARLGCAVGVFLAFAVAIWSQLTIGWQWSRPDATATSLAMVVMSSLILILVSLALLAALPVAWGVLTRICRRQARELWAPSLLFAIGAAVLAIGARHFAHGWPGTGGRPWSGRGLVSGEAASLAWAVTVSISAYWAHPSALFSFPAPEVAWMVISPVAMVCSVAGATTTVRRLELSPRVVRFEASLGSAAVVTMIVFLGGSCLWILDGGPGPRGLFHTGTIDVAGLVVMAMTFAVAHRAVRQARLARLELLAQG